MVNLYNYAKPRGLFVGIKGKGCYVFGGYAHGGYVAEKLGLKYDGDARNIADLINCQLCLEGPPLLVPGEQGHYHDQELLK